MHHHLLLTRIDYQPLLNIKGFYFLCLIYIYFIKYFKFKIKRNIFILYYFNFIDDVKCEIYLFMLKFLNKYKYTYLILFINFQ